MYNPNPYNGFIVYLFFVTFLLDIFLLLTVLKKVDRKILFILNIALPILVYTLIIRDYYYFDRNDILVHLSYVKDLIKFGKVPEYPIKNVGLYLYPGSHFLVNQLSIITGLSVRKLMIYVFPINLLLFLQFLVGIIFFKIRNNSLLLFFLTIVFSSTYIISSNYSSMPIVTAILLFFLFLNDNIMQNTIVAILVVLSVSITHPLMSLFMITYIITLIIFNRIFRIGKRYNRNLALLLFITILVFIIRISFLEYYFNFGIQRIISLFHFKEIGQLQYASTLNSLAKVSYLNLISSLFKMYSFTVIFIIAIPFIIKDLFFTIIQRNSKKKSYREKNIVIVAILSSVIFLFFNLYLMALTGFWRFLFILEFSSSIFILYILVESSYLKRSHRAKWLLYLFVILIILLKSFSIVGFLPSSYTGWCNQAVSYEEYESTKYLYDKKNMASRLYTLTQRFPLQEAIYGEYEALSRGDGRIGRYRECYAITVNPYTQLNTCFEKVIYYLNGDNKVNIYNSILVVSQYDKYYHLNIYKGSFISHYLINRFPSVFDIIYNDDNTQYYYINTR